MYADAAAPGGACKYACIYICFYIWMYVCKPPLRRVGPASMHVYISVEVLKRLSNELDLHRTAAARGA